MVYLTPHNVPKLSHLSALEKKNNRRRVLVAPLDWGLGHATRCIPIIHSLQQNGYEVIIAGEGSQAHLLQQEFPDLLLLPLPGYRVRYTQYKRLLPFKILWQLPKIMRTIRQEHRWLQKLVGEYDLNLIISDNRYGLWTRQCTCIFITHQLAIQMPFNWLSRITQQINYQYINKYNRCWVPDIASKEVNLAGALSHPEVLPDTPTRYIGPLTRLKPLNSSYTYKWLFILSGPEPQRSLLEEKLLQIAPTLNAPVFLLRARPGDTVLPKVPANCTVANHLDSKDLEKIFAASEYVVSRSGYTTVMELLALGKKSILIPTPGQTEQEYLGFRLKMQQWCYCCHQDDDLTSHFKAAEAFSYHLPDLPADTLQEAVVELPA